MTLDVREVRNKKDIKSFIDFPHELYKDDPFYVPELFMAQKEMFDTAKYPFYEYGKAKNYLAYRGDKIVGRISAISNPRFNDYHNSNVGFFGFFDTIDDLGVSEALVDKVRAYSKELGYDKIMGPTNFTTNETAGLLVDGFTDSPKIMMTYNAPYYADLMDKMSLKKEMDLYAYFIPTKTASEKYIKMSDMVEARLKKQGITIRNVNLKNFKEEIKKVKQVYNLAWEKNWGFVPFTDAEFAHLADGLKMLIDPRFAYIAEDGDNPVGFSISLPNINQITKGFKKGRLFPFNIIRLLLNKKKCNTVRIAASGVLEDYRNKGVAAVFFAKNIAEARNQNLEGGEASWILENNQEMRLAAEKLNGRLYKTYRLYSQSI